MSPSAWPAEMDHRHALLDGLMRELEGLLRALDVDQKSGDAATLKAWDRCQESFRRFSDLQASMGDEPLPAGVRTKMEDVLRLHAIAVSNAQRTRLEVQEELVSLHDSREKLRSTRLQGAGQQATNCDVSG